MKLLIKNIAELAGISKNPAKRLKGKDMAKLNSLKNAYLYVVDGLIKEFGTMDSMPEVDAQTEVIDAQQGTVLPTFCDPHTHIVYAASRETEFVDKINGLSYEEIAKRGGGILNSADRLHTLTEDQLYQQATRRLNEIILKGTGCIEIKSGYGLTVADELKMLRVVKRIKETYPIEVKSTFLGAHAVGREYAGRQAEYVDLIVNEMLPNVAKEGLADFIDVFCDRGFFTKEETIRLLEEGEKYGLRGKIHGQELADSGGVEAAVQCNALSVDHLEVMTDNDIELLKYSETMPTALPGTSFFLNMPFAPARKMIENGLSVAIASDYNPGSTPSGDMKFAVSLACIKMRLLPEEAINAATINSAYAMNTSDILGTITPGKYANFYITEQIPSIAFIPYSYTTPIIKRVFIKGEEFKAK